MRRNEIEGISGDDGGGGSGNAVVYRVKGMYVACPGKLTGQCHTHTHTHRERERERQTDRQTDILANLAQSEADSSGDGCTSSVLLATASSQSIDIRQTPTTQHAASSDF